MTKEQATALENLLSGFLRDSPLNEETVYCFAMYQTIRDLVRLGGVESLRSTIELNAQTELSEDYTVRTPYLDVKDILFGDITQVPPLLKKYPTLCAWRLSLIE